MRALWNALETLDRAVLVTLEKRDRWLGRGALLERTQKATAEVKPPQRIITFEN